MKGVSCAGSRACRCSRHCRCASRCLRACLLLLVVAHAAASAAARSKPSKPAAPPARSFLEESAVFLADEPMSDVEAMIWVQVRPRCPH